ncbi:hypothetical protein HDU87_007289 [Geranomyces variabilis]|uniref:Uncharacterized protein n=1 Tax=Geranomyces variabilis TaxID=109894 RepID=A0AAD5TDZ3_9FUNG|nr:hypothetical protein HDU87_007289 [Geranomyces variabilis]
MSTTTLTTSQKHRASHAKPAGPGDARPTALEIIADETLLVKQNPPALTGKKILITGASSGIGIETARALHATGADVYIAVRNVAAGEKVAEEIKNEARGDGLIKVLEVDLGSLDSVRKCAEAFSRESETLNVLVANAGVMACPYSLTVDGYETQFACCHLGHFLLFQLLRPHLLRGSTPEFNSRYVSLSSIGHRGSTVDFTDINFKTREYNGWTAYGQAKTANIWMANEIERRFGAQGLHATSVHPGGILTPLQRHLSEETISQWKVPAVHVHMKSPPQGAATTVWAAVSREWEGKGGKYLAEVDVAEPQGVDAEGKPTPGGYKPWAYDAEGARKLWEVSNEMVGFSENA